MSRKRCKRKVWNLVNPIQHAMLGAAVTQESHLDQLRIRELMAIEAFAKGHATKDDWRSLADMLNITETLATSGVAPEALQPCQQAQQALSNAHGRHKGGKSLGFTGPELQAIRDAYEYHDLQRQSISRSEYEGAIKKTTDRIRSAHPDLKVYA